ncbi:MAG: RNA-binding S4 domain-containing protein [Saprospiraceae bacterium]|nr:RNA-binding S4 domain-containing protein [Saprospiraceae bacterium]
MKKVRIDKWLWSVRIYKSRTLASDNCRKGRVKIGEVKAKPSQLVMVGDRVHVHKNGFNLEFEVVELLEKRVSAPLAQAAYVDHTPASELGKFDDWFIGKASAERREKGEGRPTKKERRELDTFKDDVFEK